MTHHHHPKHVFNAAKAKRLMDSKWRMIEDPPGLVRQMGIKTGMHVADLGCGPGFFTQALLHAVGSQGSVVGVELQQPIIDLFNEINATADNLRIKQGDVVDTGLTESSLDAVFIAFTLHEVKVMDALAEIKRVVKPGGLLAVLDWGLHASCPEREGKKAGPPEDHRLLLEDLRRHLVEAGLSEKEQGIRMGGCQYWISALIA
ncbi:MAG: class I SAM-dependent methyltransferase [Magnetococcales bacterium]|nr:class I SAM-dependent methyltransferase [Magnetococcales bacterium]